MPDCLDQCGAQEEGFMEKRKVRLYPKVLPVEDTPINFDPDDWTPESVEKNEDASLSVPKQSSAEELEDLRILEIRRIKERHSLLSMLE